MRSGGSNSGAVASVVVIITLFLVLKVMVAVVQIERLKSTQVIEIGKVTPALAIITAGRGISKANTCLMNWLVCSFMCSNICTEY